MYSIIEGIIGFVPNGSTYLSADQELIICICGGIICISVITFIDLMYRVFRHFWR